MAISPSRALSLSGTIIGYPRYGLFYFAYSIHDDSFGIGISDESLSNWLFPLDNSTLMLSAVSISFQFVSLLCWTNTSRNIDVGMISTLCYCKLFMLQVTSSYVHCCACFAFHHYMLQITLVRMAVFMHLQKFSL